MPETLARLKPFTKCTGGKRQLLPILKDLMPKEYDTYYEPFIGGGALFFDLKPDKAVINDFNTELIYAYNEIRLNPQKLVSLLREHEKKNQELGKKHYLEIREADRSDSINQMTNTERAARIMYMLRVNFNGLYRVNSKNQFNVPYGKYKKPKIVDEKLIFAISEYLNSNDITILNGDFEWAVKDAKKGDFVYFDPPYAPISATSAFTSYTHEGFGTNEQYRLRELFVELTNKGVKVMLSNSDVGAIRELYEPLESVNIIEIQANRMYTTRASTEKTVQELIIRNYK